MSGGPEIEPGCQRHGEEVVNRFGVIRMEFFISQTLSQEQY